MKNVKTFRLLLFVLFFMFLKFSEAQDRSYKTWNSHYSHGITAFKQNDFEIAEEAFVKAIKISEDFSDIYRNEKVNTVFFLGKVFAKLRTNDQAIAMVENAIHMSQDSTSLQYVERAKFLGDLYELVSEYKLAKKHYKKVLEALKINRKENTLLYAAIIGRVGNIERIEGDYDSAEVTLKKSLNSIETIEGKTHLDYGKTLSSLSIVYKKRGDYKRAIHSAKTALETIKNAVGSSNTDYALAITNLTQIYTEVGSYEKAIAMQKEAISLYDSIGKTSINYAAALLTLSNLHHETGDYRKEIPILQQIQNILDDKHAAHATINNNFGQAYDKMGNYEQALHYTKIAIQKTDTSSAKYATRLENLAYIYVKLGEMDKALETYDLAKISFENRIGTSHPNYGKLLNNIGKLYYEIGNLNEAKSYFNNALGNFLLSFDENHPNYGYYLNDYAKTILALGESEKALELMHKNISLAKANSREDTEAFYKLQFNLAMAYNSLGAYDKALPLLTDATENIKLKLGIDHPDYGKMLKSLSDTYIGLQNYDKAYPLMETVNEINITQLDKIFKFRSEVEKKSFLKMLTKNFDEMQSIPLLKPELSNSWSTMNLNNQLMLKGLLLNNSKNVLSQLETLDNKDIQFKIENYNALKRKLARQLSLSFLDRNADVDSLKHVINNEESHLVKLYSSNFKDELNLYKDWTVSRDQLKAGDIALEFSNFRVTQNNKQTDSIMYVAYAYKIDWETPKMIPLFEQRQLETLLKGNNPNTLYNAKELYHLIWHPIERYTEDANTIYVSPSGLLNQIQLAAISTPEGPSIGQLYNLVQLSNTALLVDGLTEPKTNSALLIGAIDYEYKSTNTTSLNHTAIAYLDTETLRASKATRSRGETWTYLKGTLNELNNLIQIFDTHTKEYSVLSDKYATETNIKALSEVSPNILHIATHGFFYENIESNYVNSFNLSTEDQYRLADDPLLRSGLILAGANYAWKNGTNPNDIEDGILSAMEISNLDLSTTDIVVLSACETGLGDIDGSEGVYGLQRAFKMAGVDIIVMSLWQVPDDETAEFMNLFYSNWMETNAVRKAFTMTQREMNEKYQNEPFKWAAFVLFE